jgi:hypothetical protein
LKFSDFGSHEERSRRKVERKNRKRSDGLRSWCQVLLASGSAMEEEKGRKGEDKKGTRAIKSTRL